MSALKLFDMLSLGKMLKLLCLLTLSILFKKKVNHGVGFGRTLDRCDIAVLKNDGQNSQINAGKMHEAYMVLNLFAIQRLSSFTSFFTSSFFL